MRRTRLLLEILLLLAAFGFAAAAMSVFASDQETADAAWFFAWAGALLFLFSLGLRLPLHIRGRLRLVAQPAIVGAAIGIALLANVALYRHDAHFDLTLSQRFTAPPELEQVARSLSDDVVLTYFYNGRDDRAFAAKQVLAVVARQHPHLIVRSHDLDAQPVTARQYGVKLYNTAVVEGGGRRTAVENVVDLRQVAFAIERVLKQHTQTVCFVTGHGEPYQSGHVHYTHSETLGGGASGSADLLEAPPEGFDRFKLALESIGYTDRAIQPATLTAIPEECAVVADLGPRSAYTPAEVPLLKAYLERGGRALLAYDPQFPVIPALAGLLDEVGIGTGDGVVVDPVNHYGTDQESAAVPYYPPNPVTEQVALTVFSSARPIRLRGSVAGANSLAFVVTSQDSYVRSLHEEGSVPAASNSPRGPVSLAVLSEGIWPGSGRGTFRLVVVGNAAFAANGQFPYASNGDLAVSMVRWLAGDTGTPLLKPATFSVPEIRLTHRQMQVTFLLVEGLLPLSVMLFGAAIWWRRR